MRRPSYYPEAMSVADHVAHITQSHPPTGMGFLVNMTGRIIAAFDCILVCPVRVPVLVVPGSLINSPAA